MKDKQKQEALICYECAKANVRIKSTNVMKNNCFEAAKDFNYALGYRDAWEDVLKIFFGMNYNCKELAEF